MADQRARARVKGPPESYQLRDGPIFQRLLIVASSVPEGVTKLDPNRVCMCVYRENSRTASRLRHEASPQREVPNQRVENMLEDINCSPPVKGGYPTIREEVERKAALNVARAAARKIDAERARIARKEAAADRLARGIIAPPKISDSDRIAAMVGNATGLRQDFPNLIPARPYCADYYGNGLAIRRKGIALSKRHVQVNPPSSYQWMTFDIDRQDAYLAHRDANLPPPNVIMVNPENGHAHAAYLMKSPIARHDAARDKPLRFFADVERGVANRLGADKAYSGMLVKNPLHTDWRAEWRRDEPYTLEEIDSSLFAVDKRWEPKPEIAYGAGRNVTVFDELRTVAYREVRQYKRDGQTFEAWRDRCLKLSLALNQQFPAALPISEVRAIAKSVAKWTWRKFSVEKFSAIQSARIAKRWAGHVSLDTTMPWVEMGISRRTFFRRKAAGEI